MRCEFGSFVINRTNTSRLWCDNDFASLGYVSIIIWWRVLESWLAQACVSGAREHYKYKNARTCEPLHSSEERRTWTSSSWIPTHLSVF